LEVAKGLTVSEESKTEVTIMMKMKVMTRMINNGN
jgi:hypothetical protein